MSSNVIDLASPERSPRSSHAPRVLIYSHDTFGLGHIRRCRAIANALIASFPHISILIVSGSSVISSFQFGDGVDYVRIPGVEKQSDGHYGPHHLNLDLDDTIRLRTEIIKQTVLSFDPDVVIVDKEPVGLRGELKPALDILRHDLLQQTPICRRILHAAIEDRNTLATLKIQLHAPIAVLDRQQTIARLRLHLFEEAQHSLALQLPYI